MERCALITDYYGISFQRISFFIYHVMTPYQSSNDIQTVTDWLKNNDWKRFKSLPGKFHLYGTQRNVALTSGSLDPRVQQSERERNCIKHLFCYIFIVFIYAFHYLISRASSQNEFTVRVEAQTVNLSSMSINRMACFRRVVGPGVPSGQIRTETR